MLASELFARINSQCDFAPQTQPGWLRYVSNTINDAYNEIWYSRAWTFNTKTVELNVYPDMGAATALKLFTGETDTTANPLVARLARSYFMLTIDGTVPKFYSRTDLRLLEQLSGAWLEVDGRDYQIVDYQVVSDGITTWSILFYIDQPFFGDYPVLTDIEFTDWTLKFKSYKLPEDAVDICDVSWSNNRDPAGLRQGQAFALSPRLAHDLAINMQISAAKPYSYIPQMSTYQGDTFQTFTVTQNTGVSTAFGVGKYYFAWEHVDMVTGASSGITQPITVNVTATNIISLTFTDVRTLPVGEYRRLLLGVQRSSGDMVQWFYANYYSTSSLVEYLNPDYPYTWRSGASTKTITINDYLSAASLSGATLGGGYRGQEQSHYIGNNDRRSVIFYPRLATVDFSRVANSGTSKESVATIRYISKCAPLVDAYDNPQIPAEFQHLIVFKALEAICLKFDKNVQASYYAKKYSEQYSLLLKRYGSDMNVIARKNNSMGIAPRGFFYPYTINYRG